MYVCVVNQQKPANEITGPRKTGKKRRKRAATATEAQEKPKLQQ
jgi:hypothetical protein